MYRDNWVEYNKSFYNSADMKKWAKCYLSNLPRKVTALVSIGNSGCSIASAMLTITKRDLKHLAIRKKEESAHEEYAGFRVREQDRIAIVDDFICSGDSIELILDNLFDRYDIERKNIVCILVNHRTDGNTKRFGYHEIQIPVIYAIQPKKRKRATSQEIIQDVVRADAND